MTDIQENNFSLEYQVSATPLGQPLMTLPANGSEETKNRKDDVMLGQVHKIKQEP